MPATFFPAASVPQAKPPKMTHRFSFLALLFLLSLLLSGCGKRLGTVPVSGKVTLDGGPMPTGGVVYFTPVEAFGDHPLRPGSGTFNPDGSYVVSSFADVEGLFPGVYQAHLHCWKVAPTMDGPKAQSHLPAKYERGETSDLKLTIEEGASPIEFNIDISP